MKYILPVIITGLLLHTNKLEAQVPEIRLLDVAREIEDYKIDLLRQDKNGYLWFGTNKGILRFDGIRYRSAELPEVFLNQRPTCIELKNDTLIAGYNNGEVVLIDINSRKSVKTFSIGDAAISAIAADRCGMIWIGTDGEGLFRINTDEKVNHFNTQSGLTDDVIHDIAVYEKKIALATDLGISVFKCGAGDLTFRNFISDDGIPDNLTLSVLFSDEENLLAGSENGSFYNLNLATGRVDSFLVSGEDNTSSINHILETPDNLLAISEDFRCYLFSASEKNDFQVFSLLDNVSYDHSDYLSDVIVDEEGNLVYSNNKHKIRIADYRTLLIKEHEGLNMAGLNCVLADSKGGIWFSNNDGIYQHASEFTTGQQITKRYSTKKGDSNIVAIYEGADNLMWFGMFGSGLGYINSQTGSTKIYRESDGLINDNILSISGSGNDLWIATLGGACRATLKDDGVMTFENLNESEGLKSNFIYAISYVNEENIWFGTDGQGLVKYNGKDFIFLKEQFPDMGKSVNSIVRDRTGNVWILTADKGVQCLNGNRLISVPIDNTRDRVQIYSISNDFNSDLILLTSAGIAKLNAKDLNPEFRKISISSGSDFLNTITRDPKGKIWLATNDALIRLEHIPETYRKKPKTRIDELKVMLQSTDTSIHSFNYSEHQFTFYLSSIWLKNPESVVYQYKLEGYDSTWITTRNNEVNFSKLSPGNYRFVVRSAENENWSDADLVSYSFVINKPWYFTWWFITTAILVLTGAIYFFLKFRINKLRNAEAMKRALIQSEFETLKSQINPHFLFNSFNTLIGTIQQDREKAAAYVENLSDYFRIVLEQRSKDFITVREELTLLNHYIFLQQQRFGNNFIFKCSLDDTILNEVIPPMTFQILAENAIKHNVISSSSPLILEIANDAKYINIINNLQPKLSKEPGTGIGLENIKSRYAILFDKKVIIEKTTTHYVVRLPRTTKLNIAE